MAIGGDMGVQIGEIIYFANEFDLLETHLEIHAPFVERFFVAESAVTVSGIEKPLFFKENKEMFSTWGDKLVHVEIPTDIQPKTKEWADFRIQDHEKNRYMHPIACEGVDWVMHSDCDEMLYPDKFAEGRKTLEANPDWEHSCYKLRQSKTYVNCVQKKVNVYRFIKAEPKHFSYSPKGRPRGNFVDGPAGYHFHNCFSKGEQGVDEMYLKVLNRNWMFEEGSPTREQCQYVLDRMGTIYQITEKEIPMIKHIHSGFVCDEPVAMAKRAQPLSYLPEAMQQNISRFPYYA